MEDQHLLSVLQMQEQSRMEQSYLTGELIEGSAVDIEASPSRLQKQE